MKKKLITILIITVLLSLTVISSFGAEDSSFQIEKYDDGSYATIETTEYLENAMFFSTTSTKSANRTYTYYSSSNTKEWSFTLKATFSYNGATAKATVASTDYNIYVNGWKCASKQATKSGATAKGTAEFNYKALSKQVNIGLKCSPNGSISAV